MNQKINIDLPNKIELYIKREDLLHPYISGNKFRKLKYNLLKAKEQQHTTLLTFGGAYSNHILAVAAAGKEYNFSTIGVIRGNELNNVNLNHTLSLAKSFGMQFFFVDRETYRNKTSKKFINLLKNKFENFYILPEGGTNQLAVKGCQEILLSQDKEFFTHICCAIGTGGTVSGIINSSSQNQTVLGFSALKENFLLNDIRKFAKKDNFKIINAYHFGGYGKVTNQLIEFMNWFYKKTEIPLDPIYTAKMVFGVLDLINTNYFNENAKILLIHTGGLQGIIGMNDILKQKNKETILYD